MGSRRDRTPLSWVDVLGLSCKDQTHVFWSGGGNDAVKAEAEFFAKNIGGVTLEMTGKGALLEKHSPRLDWIESQPAWKKASRLFAKEAEGEVHVFLNKNGISPTSVWNTIERPILESKGLAIITHLI